MKQPSTTYHSQSTKPKVAIVHDWLYGGGAELVVEQLHKLYPEAPIYATFATKEWRKRLDGKVVTGYLGRWPFTKLHKFTSVLRIWWYTHLDFSGYDLVISSSGAEAKGIRVDRKPRRMSNVLAALGGREQRKGAVRNGTASAQRSTQQRDTSTARRPLHINYCHAPTHYYWSRYDEYMKRPGFGIFDPIARLGLSLLVRPLRRWDYKAAQRPDFMIANSTHIHAEIKKYYGRASTVIHPPVSLNRFQKTQNRTSKRHGFVIAGRQTPYKRFDIAVQACTRLGLPLTVIGTGPDHARLRKMAGKTITFLGKVSDEVMEEEFAHAAALIFPGLDDFGITPVEAMASGTPVIAYKAGGALDYVKSGVTGEFFPRQSVDSLEQTLQKFDARKYNGDTIRAVANHFSVKAFHTNITTYIAQCARSFHTK